MNQMFDYFCRNYNITILDSTKRVERNDDVKLFTDHVDKNVFKSAISTEPLYTVTIPESKLTFLSKIDKTFFNNVEHIAQRRMFDAWINQQEAEKELRAKYPAVQQAYEAYSTLLSLCNQNNTPKLNTDLD
jgi:hypothetical protein